MGHSIRSDQMGVKSVLGVVPQEIALYEDLSARENLTFWGKMYGLRGAALQNARRRGAGDHRPDRPGQRNCVRKYSGGMKRRVNIGVALLHKPQVIYMDEPTVGIDPQSRRNILDSVVALKNQGMTVLYTTHYMEEAQELSDHIAIMDTRQDDRQRHECRNWSRSSAQMDRITVTINAESSRVLEAWKAVKGVKQVSAEDGTLTILADDSNQVLPRLFETAAANGGAHHFRRHPGTQPGSGLPAPDRESFERLGSEYKL